MRSTAAAARGAGAAGAAGAAAGQQQHGRPAHRRTEEKAWLLIWHWLWDRGRDGTPAARAAARAAAIRRLLRLLRLLRLPLLLAGADDDDDDDRAPQPSPRCSLPPAAFQPAEIC